MKKRISLIIVLLIIVLLATVLLILFFTSKEQHEILTKKFHIPIKKSYEIVFFENNTRNDLERHCYSKLKVSESEYNEILSEIKKAEYSSDSLEWYDICFENNSKWMSGEKVVEAYSKNAVESRYLISGKRTHMNIFITESKDGYRQIYMLCN